MERHPRRNEPLVIPDRLAHLLGSLRAATTSEDPPELDVDRVRDVEASVGCRLPDPVLAILAAGIGPLADGLGLGLNTILRHTRTGREARVRGDLVVFGVDPDGHLLHGFLIGADDRQVATYDPADQSLSSRDVVAWLSQQTESFCPVHPAADPVVPRLVRRAKPELAGPRARHAKWGIGRILTDEGCGDRRKVKVAFASVGLKTINARFVEFLDE